MRTVRVVSLFLFAVAAACSSAQKTEDPSKPPPPETTVEVRNLKTVDVNLFVYMLNSSSRVRLGTVPGMSTRNFVIPPRLLGDMDRIRFRVETIGSDAASNGDQELPVTAGEQLSLTIQ
ncbi:hypothetical protein JY651_20230 [Pyxidicoccus parkwayensis]|jgi:hypothetical protein|uniref:Lipoprotein n=1 Tax=Pyxidicoccus parkwayensis TaxID=2813578 RepID=A0ABX7P9I3_9BACT|nr:hypothetical protein [Pyxidicoccus parkwaysis]QSQ27096.1 hypothetical protein JY651_20230 [Pyxidicoccus parkwaysis]